MSSVEIEEEIYVFPASFAQERIWFLERLNPGTAVFNLAVRWPAGKGVDRVILEEALRKTVERHEILRTAFREKDGMVQQVVRQRSRVELSWKDVDEADWDAVDEWIERDAREPFDLTEGPLLRLAVYNVGEEKRIASLVIHHIISDGWSQQILIRDLHEHYIAAAQGRKPDLPELSIQYADFAQWQRDSVEQGKTAKDLAYWKEVLEGRLPKLELPLDRPRPARQTGRGALHRFVIPVELREDLKKWSRKEGGTLFMMLLAGYQALLHRHGGQEDILVGSPVAGRDQLELENLIGHFVNLLVFRTKLSGSLTFRELFQRTRTAALEAFEHPNVPFEKLVQELRPERDRSRSPLFQAEFVLLVPTRGEEGKRIDSDFDKVETGTSQHDLSFAVKETVQGLTVIVEYGTDLFDAKTIERMGEHYVRLLRSAVEEPDRKLSGLSLMSEEEEDLVVRKWNDTDKVYELDLLHRSFELQVERTPGAIAVEFENERLTYAELNRRSNQAAHYLRKRGVAPGVLVGISVERSLEMMVGMLGILKAGGAYVPVDSSYPKERIAYMLADSGVKLLMTQERLLAVLPQTDGVEPICLDRDWTEIAKEEGTNPGVEMRQEDLAYMIYTSGSTGRPKGAMNSHKGIANRLAWMQDAYGLEAEDRILQKTPMSFDVSVWELFWAILSGARLVIAKPGGHKDSRYLVEVVKDKAITTLHFVPSMLTYFLEEKGVEACGSLRRVICSGEALAVGQVKRFFERMGEAGTELHNLYGPTEAAVDVTSWKCRPEDAMGRSSIPLGKPIANIQMYVLDGELRPVAIGIPGELHIGGVGVCRGYHGRPELTAEKFIENPFSPAENPDRRRLYKTGDLARWLTDGSLEFLGRMDHQVKVRGFRIELGEIEAVLNKHPGVSESVVTVREREGESALAGYVRTEASASLSEELTVSGLREFLGETLPEYMIPSAFVFLKDFPLSPNGKMDRKALPEPEWGSGARGKESFEAPRNGNEVLLAEIWRNLLGLERVGIRESFFDVGGHSLLAIKLVSRIRSAFEVEIPLQAVFDGPTVAEMAEAVARLSKGAAEAQGPPPLTASDGREELPLSFAQQRMWFLSRLETDGSTYNIPFGFVMRGGLEVERLERSLDALAARHEVLRSCFVSVDGEPKLKVIAIEPFKVEVADLEEVAPDERGQRCRSILEEEARRPFDLEKAPLIRVKAVRVSAEEWLCSMTMHHIISDGWSLEILQTELQAYYRAFGNGQEAVLKPLPVQYSEYARWQRDWLRGEVLEKEARYWRSRLAGAPALLALPADRSRPAERTLKGAQEPMAIPVEVVEAFRGIARECGATLFMTLLAAFKVFLFKMSRVDDIVIGTPITGRNREETEGLIGLFLNTLVLRTDLSGDPSFLDVVRRVRETSLEAYSHQDLPFERLVDELRVERSLSHNPVFQVMFSLQEKGGARVSSGPSDGGEDGSLPQTFWVPGGTSKFDLDLELGEHPGGVSGTLEYATDLFEADTIRRWAAHFQVLLASVSRNPEAAISDLDLLGNEERNRVLEHFGVGRARVVPDRCVHEVLGDIARSHAEKEALRYEGSSMTYGELERCANQLAWYLADHGVGPEKPVGICMERGFDMFVGLLGIMKAGGAYVPLDPEYPWERLSAMAEDAGLGSVLTQEIFAERWTDLGVEVLCLDRDWKEIEKANEGVRPPDTAVSPGHMAYMIYTSGSTGRPKGAMLTHRSLLNHLMWRADTLGYSSRDRFLFMTPYSFDASIDEIFHPLFNGSSIVIAKPGGRRDMNYLYETIEKEEVDVLAGTPSLLEALMDHPKAALLGRMKSAALGGEAFPSKIWNGFRKRFPETKLYNVYGPTETTIEVSSDSGGGEYEGAVAPLGDPVDNTRLYVLDEGMNVVPVGVPGELYIGGIPVGRGYRGRPDLTAERFVPDPFGEETGGRLYRSGDLVRYHDNGVLEYLGRIDSQVKIRGYRIELGEIEDALNRCEGVRHAAVMVRGEDGAGKRLVGYAVPGEGGELNAARLKEELGRTLPEYMVPGVFVFLKEMPMMPNGKIDRKALPEPELPVDIVAFAPPRTETEQKVEAVWKEVLRIEKAGVDQNFFDLGGHSLTLARVHSKLTHLGYDELTIVDLFKYPTIRALAAHMTREETGPQKGASGDVEDPDFDEDEEFGRGRNRLQRRLMRSRDED